jgi:hypothetical protein
MPGFNKNVLEIKLTQHRQLLTPLAMPGKTSSWTTDATPSAVVIEN